MTKVCIAIDEQITENRAGQLICRKCGQHTAIGDTVYVQNHFYEPPSLILDHGYKRMGYLPLPDAHWECACGTANLITRELAKLKSWFRAVRHEQLG